MSGILFRTCHFVKFVNKCNYGRINDLTILLTITNIQGTWNYK